MAKRPLPSPEVLRQLLDYCPATGVLRWKERGLEWFPSEGHMKTWNTLYAGKVAGGVDGRGYLQVRIQHHPHRSHRVAWAIVHGRWPDRHIDHINGTRTDNRLCNLREVTARENHRNRKRFPRNKSGVVGVFWSRHNKAWVAYINGDQGHVRLGSFQSKEEAASARRGAERRLGYHPDHGRLA